MKNETDKLVKKQGYIIIFLERERFDLYESVNRNTFSFPFAPTAVNALDVINAEEFQNQLNVFIDQNQINPADILMIVSARALFEKDIYIGDLEPSQVEAMTKSFISTVPYDVIYSKTINFQGGIRISAANKNLCDAIIYAFEKKGSRLNGIVPYEALSPDLATISTLDSEAASYAIKNFDSLKSQSFPLEEKVKKTEKTQINPDSSQEATVRESKKEAPNKTRIIAMAGVFGVLVIVLIYLVLNPPA